MHVFTSVLSWDLGILCQVEGAARLCSCQYFPGSSEYFRTYDLIWYSSHTLRISMSFDGIAGHPLAAIGPALNGTL